MRKNQFFGLFFQLLVVIFLGLFTTAIFAQDAAPAMAGDPWANQGAGTGNAYPGPVTGAHHQATPGPGWGRGGSLGAREQAVRRWAARRRAAHLDFQRGSLLGAGPGPIGPVGPLGMFQLSAEQQQQMYGLVNEADKKQWDLKGQINYETRKLQQLYSAEALDPKAIGEMHGRIFDLQRQIIEASLQASNDMMGVLTSEQQERLRRMRGLPPQPGPTTRQPGPTTRQPGPTTSKPE